MQEGTSHTHGPGGYKTESVIKQKNYTFPKYFVITLNPKQFKIETWLSEVWISHIFLGFKSYVYLNIYGDVEWRISNWLILPIGFVVTGRVCYQWGSKV